MLGFQTYLTTIRVFIMAWFKKNRRSYPIFIRLGICFWVHRWIFSHFKFILDVYYSDNVPQNSLDVFFKKILTFVRVNAVSNLLHLGR